MRTPYGKIPFTNFMMIECEKTIPCIMSFTCGVLFYIISRCLDYNIELSTEILQSGITVGAIFAGFDAVHKNTLLELNSGKFKRLKSTSYRKLLRTYIDSSLRVALLFIVSSFTFSFLPECLKGTWCFPAWLFLFLWMILTYWRINRIMRLLF